MQIGAVENLTLEQKAERIRTLMLKGMPFYGTIACSIGWSLREDLPFPTAATDGLNVYWHPEFLKNESEETLIFVATHEIHHIIKMHSWRLRLRDHDLFNIACDHQINLELSLNGLKGKTPTMYCDEQYKDMVEEDIYAKLLETMPKAKYNGSSGYCLPSPNGKSEGDAKRKIDAIIETAAQVAESVGKLPGYLQKFLRENRQAQINWKAQLRNIVEPLFPRDVSWERPNRRLIHSGIYIPGAKLDGTAEIAVLFDTSGSVSDKEVNLLLAELNAILSSVQPVRTQIHWFESHVWKTDILGPGQMIKTPTELKRGGTNFRAAFEAIQGNPRIVICLTDMGDSFEFKKPRGQTIWVSTTGAEAPWGRTIKIKN